MPTSDTMPGTKAPGACILCIADWLPLVTCGEMVRKVDKPSPPGPQCGGTGAGAAGSDRPRRRCRACLRAEDGLGPAPPAHVSLQSHAIPRRHFLRRDGARALHGRGATRANRLPCRRVGGARDVPVSRSVARRGRGPARETTLPDSHGLREKRIRAGARCHTRPRALPHAERRCLRRSRAAPGQRPDLLGDRIVRSRHVRHAPRRRPARRRQHGHTDGHIAEYDKEHVHPNGCGGSEAAGKIYLRAGGGTQAEPTHADLYAFTLSGFTGRPQPPNTPRPVRGSICRAAHARMPPRSTQAFMKSS